MPERLVTTDCPPVRPGCASGPLATTGLRVPIFPLPSRLRGGYNLSDRVSWTKAVAVLVRIHSGYLPLPCPRTFSSAGSTPPWQLRPAGGQLCQRRSFLGRPVYGQEVVRGQP